MRQRYYYLAEQTGWGLYVESPSDLAILRAFAATLGLEAERVLGQSFVYYLESNKPSKAASHFQGLREAKSDLQGIAIFDRIPPNWLQKSPSLTELVWRRRV